MKSPHNTKTLLYACMHSAEHVSCEIMRAVHHVQNSGEDFKAYQEKKKQ